MNYLYNLLLYLLTPVLIARLIFRGIKNSAYFRRWPERFARKRFEQHDHTIWVHAVSVGEVKATVPLVKAIQKDYPQCYFLITTMTPTGAQQVVESFAGKVEHRYVPYDYPGAVSRFLEQAAPVMAVVMETEIWPNLIRITRSRNIPLFYANVRLSQRSYLGYKKFSRFLAPLLARVNGFSVQATADAERMKQLGASPEMVTVTGSIKFEIRLRASVQEISKVTRREWGVDRKVWVAGSTRAGEEELLLTAFDRLKQKLPNLLLVLVPRHPERFNSVAKICEKSGYKIIRRSVSSGDVAPNVDIYIGDTMGELQLFYAAADVVYVGGSLVPTGGHNILEASAVGAPVIFGPHMFNFVDISQLTIERRAGIQVSNVAELESAVEKYFADAELRFSTGENGKKLVEENRGALEKTAAMLSPCLSEVFSPGK